MLTENEIVKRMVEHLQKNSYTIISTCLTSQKGIDIVAKDPGGRILCMECKGETSSKTNTARFGKLFTGNQVWNHIAVSILKIMTLQNDPKYQNSQFALVLPVNHQPLIETINNSLKLLSIAVYIVGEHQVDQIITTKILG